MTNCPQCNHPALSDREGIYCPDCELDIDPQRLTSERCGAEKRHGAHWHKNNKKWCDGRATYTHKED